MKKKLSGIIKNSNKFLPQNENIVNDLGEIDEGERNFAKANKELENAQKGTAKAPDNQFVPAGAAIDATSRAQIAKESTITGIKGRIERINKTIEGLDKQVAAISDVYGEGLRKSAVESIVEDTSPGALYV